MVIVVLRETFLSLGAYNKLNLPIMENQVFLFFLLVTTSEILTIQLSHEMAKGKRFQE